MADCMRTILTGRALRQAAWRPPVPLSLPGALSARALSPPAAHGTTHRLRGLSTNAAPVHPATGTAANASALAAENERLKDEVRALRAQAAQAAEVAAGAARRRAAAAGPPGPEHGRPIGAGPAAAAAVGRIPALSTAGGGEADYSNFVGAPRSRFTPELAFWDPRGDPSPPSPMPCFRLIDDVGQVRYEYVCSCMCVEAGAGGDAIPGGKLAFWDSRGRPIPAEPMPCFRLDWV